jgi:hypothetical protein
MSQTHGFLRSKLKEPAKVTTLLLKIEAIVAKKPNAFNVDFKGLPFYGEKMSNLDLTTDPTKITFTYDAVDYELLLADIKIVQRIRSRKYKFKTNVLTVV